MKKRNKLKRARNIILRYRRLFNGQVFFNKKEKKLGDVHFVEYFSVTLNYIATIKYYSPVDLVVKISKVLLTKIKES